jgi:hypothetical protein
MTLSPDPLPLLPTELLRRHHCAEPLDTRFRAVARLRQSLWRQQQGYACGHYLDANGHPRRLGSRVTPRIAQTGVNLVDPALVPLVRREIAYREIGAVIEVERLWTNLLASQTLTFSLFGPLKQDLALATAVLRPIAPDLVGEVTDVRFEHSPGRGQPQVTADHTAFDVLVRCRTPKGDSAFLAVEIKYTESPAGIAAASRPRYDELSRLAQVFRDPEAAALRHGPIEQFWREQLLVTAMLHSGRYDQGRLVVIAPALNVDCQTAIARFQAEMSSPDPQQSRFQALTLEQFLMALGTAGADNVAAKLIDRYVNFAPVHNALAETFQRMPDATTKPGKRRRVSPAPPSQAAS